MEVGGRCAARALFLAFVLAAPPAWGQAVEPELEAVGPAWFDGGQRSKAAAEREVEARPPSLGLNLTPPAAAALPPLSPDELARLRPHGGLVFIGVHRALPEEAAESSFSGVAARTTVTGAWQATVVGRLWRLQVTSPGARALRIHFQDFDAGKGSVWVHAADGQIDGPHSGRGMWGDGDFWSDIVFGDSATIEYRPDPAAAPAAAAPFRIAAVSHIRSVPGLIGGDGPPAGAAEAKSRTGNPSERLVAAEAQSLSSGPPSPAGHTEPAPCHQDVSCYSDFSPDATGVAHIQFENEKGSRVCSGALLNDRHDTRTPYFLTAAHCINTDAEARTVIAYWRYRTQTCNGTPPSRSSVPRTQGARLLATMDGGVRPDGIRVSTGGDATLLRLAEAPPAGTWFLGWDAGPQSVGTSVTGIHHPAGSYKRISFGRIASQEYSYHEVSWSRGLTEPGSSGSPLFEGFEGSGTVIGISSFLERDDEHEDLCLTNPITGYMKFSDFYPRIRRFLWPETETGPTISSNGIVLATGTPVVNRISPNALISVFGQDFAPQGTQASSPVLDAAGRVASKLADTCLEIDGRRAPLFAVFPTQINAQTPHNLASGAQSVEVIRGCGTGEERRGRGSVFVRSVTPALFNFRSNPSGRNPIAALHGGGLRLAGAPGLIPGVAFTPAEPGEYVILFGTGFGTTQPPLAAGQIPGGPVSLASTVSFTFGGIAVPPRDIFYAGATPCCAGLYQFTVRVPRGLPNGDASVIATVRGASPPAGPFLTVRR